MKLRKKFYKAAFWIAVIIIVVLVVSLVKLTYNPRSDNESVSYLDLDNDSDGTPELVVTSTETVTLTEPQDEVEEVPDEPEEEVETNNGDLQVIVLAEGDLLSFPNLKAEDPDGDELEFEFSEPLNDDGEWQTEVGDAGNYQVSITVSDGESSVTEKLMVIVEALNKAPVIEVDSEVEVEEGDIVELEPVVTDPEGEALQISYSGWMTTNTKETGYDDAGEYEVVISASDGIDEVSETVTITVNNVNRKPGFVSII